MPDRAAPLPPHLRAFESKRRLVVRGLIAAAVLAFSAFYVWSFHLSYNLLDVTLVNDTGGALTDVVFGDMPHLTPFPKVEAGAKVRAYIPLTDSPRISFRGPDGVSRSNPFMFHDSSGMYHRIKVVLGKRREASESELSIRTTRAFGSEVLYQMPFDYGDHRPPLPPDPPVSIPEPPPLERIP